MPWHSLNASRTRRSETPATALRSLSVTLWYCTLAAYCMHAHTMCKLAGRTRAGAGRANRVAMPESGSYERSDRRSLRFCSVTSTIRAAVRYVARLDAVVLLARVCVRRQRATSASNRSSERMICLCGAAVVLRTGCFASSVWKRSHPIRMTFDGASALEGVVDLVSDAARDRRSRRGDSGATNDRRDADQRCDDVFVAGTRFERTRDRAPTECFGCPERHERADPDERVGPWARARRIERPDRRAQR